MHVVRQACARDLAGTRDRNPIVRSDHRRHGRSGWAASLSPLPVTIDLDGDDGPFHFGRRLAEVIDRFQLARVLYMGAASAPLLTVADLAQIAAGTRQHDRAVIANNINSTDWAAITPASIVRDWIDRLPGDNSLGWVLSHEAGLEPIGGRLHPPPAWTSTCRSMRRSPRCIRTVDRTCGKPSADCRGTMAGCAPRVKCCRRGPRA